MSFAVSADAYAAFMGRFSEPLAPLFADLAGAGIGAGQRALDVGCGPGALTAELARRLGPAAVWAVEPSESFARAAARREPAAWVGQAAAEHLPFPDDVFDLAAAQLVVHFMTDPVDGLREMGRVTRPGGLVAACVWDHAGGRGPLSAFWQAALELDPAARDESALAGAREGHLAELFRQAGLGPARSAALTVTSRYASFDDWWQPYTLGVGPAGAHLASLAPERRAELRERCRPRLPAGSFEITAAAWAAAARAR
jgi:SAM-dependent methyltransferase